MPFLKDFILRGNEKLTCTDKKKYDLPIKNLDIDVILTCVRTCVCVCGQMASVSMVSHIYRTNRMCKSKTQGKNGFDVGKSVEIPNL